MSEPIDPNYRPPLPFTPPAQRSAALPEQPPPFYPQQYPPQPYPAANAQPYPYPPSAGQPYSGQVPPPYPPYGVPWQPAAPPPSHRRRNVLIAVAVVVVLAVAGVGIYASTGSSSPGRVAIPQSFDGYSQEHDATGDRVASMIRGFVSGAGGAAQQVIDTASIALYQNDADVTSKLVVLALRTSAVPGGGSADEFAGQMLAFMGSTVSSYPPGPHGGSLRCGQTSIGVVTESGCAWSDPTTTGMIVSVRQDGNPTVPPETLANVVVALQQEIE